MRMPTSNGRNANPGTLASESAWTNRGRNVPGRTTDPAEGDPMRGIVKESGRQKKIYVEVGTARTDTRTMQHAVRYEMRAQSWKYSTLPEWAPSDPAVVVTGGQMQFYDAERAKVVYEPYSLQWRAEVELAQCGTNLVYLMAGGHRTVAVTHTVEVAGRFRAVRYSEHEMQTPDLEEICTEWRARETVRRIERAAKRARNRGGNRKTWGTGTVRTSEIIPE